MLEEVKVGDWVALKRDGAVGRVVHVYEMYPFRGDVVVLVGDRREMVSLSEIEKVEHE